MSLSAACAIAIAALAFDLASVAGSAPARHLSAYGDTFAIDKLTADSDIRDHFAELTLEATIRNKRPLEANCSNSLQWTFELSKDSLISSYKLQSDGRLFTGQVKEANEAKEEYDEAKENKKAASLVQPVKPVEARATRLYMLNVNVPCGKNAKITLQTQELLKMKGGKFTQALTLDTLGFDVLEFRTRVQVTDDGAIVEKARITCAVGTDPASTLTSSDLPAPTESEKGKCGFNYESANFQGKAALAFSFDGSGKGDAGGRLLAASRNMIFPGSSDVADASGGDGHTCECPDGAKFYAGYLKADGQHLACEGGKDSGTWDGSAGSIANMPSPKVICGDMPHPKRDLGSTCFMHMWGPTETLKPLSKTIAFAIDVSGSMTGVKIGQAKDAFKLMVGQLSEDDRFVIYPFSSNVQRWPSDNRPVSATPQNIDRARTFIDGLNAEGGTNIYDSVLESLRTMGREEVASGRLKVAVLMTDGEPTEGEYQKTDDLIRVLTRKNYDFNSKDSAVIYCVGFGRRAKMDLMDGLAQANQGYAQRVYEGKDATAQLAGFFGEIRSPMARYIKFGATLTAGTDRFLPHFPGDNQGLRVDSSDQAEGFSGATRSTYDVLNDGSQLTYMCGMDLTDGEVGELAASNTLSVTTKYVDSSNAEINTERTSSYVASAGFFNVCRKAQVNKLVSDFLAVERFHKYHDRTSKATAARGKALELAIDHQLVVQGLTAMVVVADDEYEEVGQDKPTEDAAQFASSADGSVHLRPHRVPVLVALCSALSAAALLSVGPQ